jgi:hypothetical protein
MSGSYAKTKECLRSWQSSQEILPRGAHDPEYGTDNSKKHAAAGGLGVLNGEQRA